MKRRMSLWRSVGVLAAVVTLAGIAPASAQTQGMDRRNQRRDNRAAARAREAGLQSRRREFSCGMSASEARRQAGGAERRGQ